MKSRSFLILLVTCCGLAVITYLVLMPDKQNGHQVSLGQQPFESLAINDITAITITGPESATVLIKQQTFWAVANRFNYRADFAMISDLAKKIKALKIGRRFSASPETVSRLALHPPDRQNLPKNHKGIRIKLADENQKTLLDLIVGKVRETSSHMGGQYVSPANTSTVYLVDRDFRYLETKPFKWLDKNLIDINAQEIEKVIVYTPEKDKILYTLKRPEKEKKPIFVNPPEGKTAAISKINRVFAALSGLTIEDIADPGKPITLAGHNRPHLNFYLFNGMVYHIYPGGVADKNKKNYYFKANVTYSSPAITSGKPQPENRFKQKNGPQKQTGSSARAEQLNRNISPWTYIVSKWTSERFTTDPHAFFEPEATSK